jgi:hypothetical protein
MTELKEMDTVLTSVQRLERRLLRAVLGSFLFSLLPVATLAGTADWAFRAEVQLLGSLMGAGGFLAAYVGNIRHPLEEPHPLDFFPIFWGARITLMFSAAAGALYLFYVYGKNADPLSLLFLATGNFIAFYGFATAAIGLQKAERQKAIWSSMTTAQRLEWINRRNERKRKFEEIHDSVAETLQRTKNIIRQFEQEEKQSAAAERAAKRKAFAHAIFIRSTYSLRKKIGLLTLKERTEDMEVEIQLEQYREKANQDVIAKLRRGDAHPLRLEGGQLTAFVVNGWKLIPIDAALDHAGANELLKRIDVFEKDDNRKLKGVMIVVGQSADVSYEARQLLLNAGAKVIDEKLQPE